jgi:fumarate hydratase class I
MLSKALKNSTILFNKSKCLFAAKPFKYQNLFETDPNSPHKVPFTKITKDHVTTKKFDGKEFLHVAPEGLTLLSETAMGDIGHYLRPGHLG